MGMSGGMHACSRCCFLLAALCVVSLKLLRHPKGGRLIQTSSRPRSSRHARLQHPGCNTAQGTSQAAQVHSPASPAAAPHHRLAAVHPLSEPVSVLPYHLVQLVSTAALGDDLTPIKPSRFSPITAGARPRKETTLPSAQSLGLDRDACHTSCLSSPTVVQSDCSLCTTICTCTHAECIRHTHWKELEDWGREVCDVSVVSPKFRRRPHKPQSSSPCCKTPPQRREACDRTLYSTCTIDRPARFSTGFVGLI